MRPEIIGSKMMRTAFSRSFIAALAICLSALATEAAEQASATAKLMFIGWTDHRVILAHDEIEALGLQRKSSIFYFDNDDVLRGIELGDHVLFEAEQRNGNFVVTRMQKTDVGDDEHHH